MNIKFRAWDKIVNPPRMKTWEQLLAQYQLTQVFTSGNDFLELMQDTGLKDCKGNEAYEGDILKEWFSKYSSKPQSTSYGIIKREEDTCNLYIEWYYEGKYDGETYWGTRELPLRKVKELLIVGNIYQNKDLLKGED